MIGAGEAEIGLALGERVTVEENLFGPAVARRADDQRMLTAEPVARRVGIGAVGRRHRRIVFPDPAAQLGDEGRLEPVEGPQHRRRIGVLGLEIGRISGSMTEGSRITARHSALRSHA